MDNGATNKLDETRNLIDLYLWACGESEVPQQFHRWACLSMMAAAVGDKVRVEKWPGKYQRMHLYVFLIGPSGVGKEQAISQALMFVADLPVVNAAALRATAPFIIDKLGKGHQVDGGPRVIANPRLYLVTEELGMSVRAGELAQDTLTLMTGLYGDSPVPREEGTRTAGRCLIKNANINWLAGSTPEWLKRSIPPDAIEGGFWARVLAIRGERDYEHPYPEPIYPVDRDVVMAHLLERVRRLTQVAGPPGSPFGVLFKTEAARAWHNEWYRTRYKHPPEEEALKPTFNREDEMLHKLAGLLLLAEWDPVGNPDEPFTGEIDVSHLEDAAALYHEAHTTLPYVLNLAAATPESSKVDRVATFIQRKKAVGRAELSKWVSGRLGMSSVELNVALGSLIDQGRVSMPVQLGRAKVYRWMEG